MKAKISLTKAEAEIEASQQEAESFLSKILPNYVKEFGGILTDTVRLWRFKNQVRIVNEAKRVVEKNNLSEQQVPLKVLGPILENSSLEEDSTVQAMWVNLLANAASNSKINVNPNFAEILKELSPIEAKILDMIFVQAEKQPNYEERKKYNLVKRKSPSFLIFQTRMQISL